MKLYPYKIKVVHMLITVNKQQKREVCLDFLQFVSTTQPR